MSFKEGEKIAFLNETGSGTILKFVSSNQVMILDENGFEQVYEIKNLVKIYGSPVDHKAQIPEKDEEFTKQQQKYTVLNEKASSSQKDYWELDLHIEQLTDSHKGMSNFEIMRIQLNKFKQFFTKAKANKINKIIVIHGVGEGVLKNELRTFLANQEGIEFFDASYLEYGKGATEVRFRQNL